MGTKRGSRREAPGVTGALALSLATLAAVGCSAGTTPDAQGDAGAADVKVAVDVVVNDVPSVDVVTPAMDVVTPAADVVTAADVQSAADVVDVQAAADVVDVQSPTDVVEAATCTGANMMMCGATCTNTQTDVNNCGRCGRVCTADMNRINLCVAGECMAPCRPDFHACGMTCRDNASVDSCGTRCERCPNGPTNSRPICQDAMTCAWVCEDGFIDVGSNCVPVAVPRQVGPLSTSFVTSLQPTFRWELPPRVDGARVEICSNRACTGTLVASFDAVGTSGQPPTALPAQRVLFWRIRGRAGSSTSNEFSPVWQFRTGRRSATVNTALPNTAHDFNGDGYDDIVIASSSDQPVAIYHGGPSGVATPGTPTRILTSPSGSMSGFGYAPATGDFNGDGVADLAISNYRVGRVVTYFGRQDMGLETSPSWNVAVPIDPLAPVTLAVQDVNGDGFDDLIMGRPNLASTGVGGVDVYFGSATGLATTSSQTLTAPSGTGLTFGSTPAGIGDFDGDGFGDVFVGSPCAPGRCGTTSPGTAHVFRGGTAGLFSTPVIEHVRVGLPNINDARFGSSPSVIGDLNADGFGDYAFSAAGASRAYTCLGSAMGPSAECNLIVGDAGTYFGGATAGTDLDGDGRGDVLIGAGYVNGTAGRLYVVNSRNPGTPVLINAPDGGTFSVTIAAVGDVNGDGFGDVVVSAPEAIGGAGRAYLFLGRMNGIASTPSAVFTPPSGNRNFGLYLASRSPQTADDTVCRSRS